jgi:GNAT superfamily N-acetyltransferase
LALVSRKVVRLTLDHLAELEGPCRSCLFWQLDPVSRARVCPQDAIGEKETWVSQVLRDWGSCGRVVLVDDVPAGFVLYAPPSYLPGAAQLATAPVSPDAVLLTHVYVDPAYAGGGLGRMLVQGMARDLIKRGGIRAVEAFAAAAWCPRTSWAASASRPSARTAPPHGCGWSCARRCRSATRSRRPWSGSWASYAPRNQLSPDRCPGPS